MSYNYLFYSKSNGPLNTKIEWHDDGYWCKLVSTKCCSSL